MSSVNESLCPSCILSAWSVFLDMLCHSWFEAFNIGCLELQSSGVCWGHGDKCPDSSSLVLSSGRTATNCSVNNGYCDHECHESEDGLGRTCSCIKGYQLQDNSRKRIAKSKLPQQNANINNIVCASCKYTDDFLHWWFCIHSAKINA